MKFISKKRRPRVNHEQRVFYFGLLCGLPATIALLILLWHGNYTPKLQWTVSIIVVCFWLAFAHALRQEVVRPLQTIANLLMALREGDYSIRGTHASPTDSLGEVMLEVNALSKTLHEQRLGALEASALLRTVMQEIDIAIFAFDHQEQLRLVNRAGERLLGRSAEWLTGRTATELELLDALRGDESRILEISFPGGSGRWELRRTIFRQSGLPHQLVVLSDLSRTLRQEERQAWQRIIRVIGHELNNSLAPIKSIAASLESILGRTPLPDDWQQDTKRGLSVIGARSESLSNFMEAYARLARLPEPTMKPMEVESWIRHVAGLETRLVVEVQSGAPLTLEADRDQLDQLLINLVRNAADAALETGGGVRVGWSNHDAKLEVWVEDDGPGLASSANLFVPFFTTKQGGSGIGLVFSRQIAEAHHGRLVISNRPDTHGCVAKLTLPL